MSSKNLTSKEKKEKRKQQIKEENDLKNKLTSALENNDPLNGLHAFKTFTRNGLNLLIEYINGPKEVSPNVMDWMFNLLKLNMESLYIPVWGWSDSKKGEN